MVLPRNFDFKFQRFIHDWYFTLIIVYCLFLLLFGWQAILYFYVIPSALVHIHQSFINIFSHSGEYNEDSKDYSNNIPWIVWLYPVLGYHHVHHLNPKWHRLGKYDLAATLIEKIFRR
jgi:fatty acid desaturase